MIATGMVMKTDQASCPWSGYEPASITFCEADACAWIIQPANTWSNLAFIVIGAWLIRLALREGHPSLAAIGTIEVLVGIGSFFFHMSGTHIGEVVDVGAMYLLSGYVLVANLARYRAHLGRPLSPVACSVLFVALVLGSVVAIAVFKGQVGVVLFAIQATLAGHLEIRMRRRFRDSVDYKPLVKFLVCFAIAWTFWWLDLLRIQCSPDNHWLQFHATWHLFNSVVFVFLYRFYAQLREAAGPESSR